MNDRTLVTVMVSGIGAHLTSDEKRAHLIDLKREHLIGQGRRAGNLASEKMTYQGASTVTALES
jgi:hypothetical protein